jgi:serine/threonine-protein kinase
VTLPAESIARPSDQSSSVSFGPFTFDRLNGLLQDGSREIPLPPRALGVLDVLVSRAGVVASRQELIDAVWRDAFVTDTSLAEAVSVLRQALGDDPQSPRYIQTVHRRGYRFVAQVTAIPAITTATISAPNSVVQGDRATPSISQHFLPWGIAALCATLATIAVWQYTHFRAPTAPVVRMRIEPAAGTSFDLRAPALALSPDGLTLAWSACDSTCRLYIRAIDQLDAQTLPGTDDASAPFFSPDGRWIGFFAAGKLQKVAVAGGMPVVVAEASQPFGAVWLPDGHIVFAASAHGGLMRVNDSGGDSEPLTTPTADAGEIRHCWPALAPGGQALLFTVATAPHDEAPGRIASLPIGQRTGWQTILENADSARAVSQDYVAFSRGTEIHAIAFDRARQRLAGADQTVVSNVARGQFALSLSGAFVYAIGEEANRPSLTWIPATQTVESGDLAAFHDLAVTPDGSRVAGINSGDVWVGDVNRGTTTRLTHGGTNVSPTWSTEGSSVYYAVRNAGPFEVWQRDSSGTTPAKLALSAAARHRHVFPTSLSRDGTLMAYTESGGSTHGDVKVASLSNGATIAAVETPFDETSGALSPDGRLLAYQSDESGRWEIYLLKLDDRQRLPVSSAGGEAPMWSANGNSLVYRAGNATIRVKIDGSGQPVGAPISIPTPAGAVLVGISDDRILARTGGDSPASHAVLTLEWARDLQRMLGPPATALPR